MLARLCKLPAFFLDFIEQPHVLDRDYGLVGEGGYQLDLLVGKGPDLGAGQHHHADRVALPQQWDPEGGAKAGRFLTFDKIEFPIGQNIVNLNGLTINQGSPSDRPPSPHKSSSLRKLDEFQRKAETRRKLQDAILRLRDRGLIRFAQARCQLDQRIEHRFEIESGAADDLEHVGSGGLLLERFAQIARACLHLVEQPHVLDRDHGLIGEGRNQFDLFFRKRSRRYPR